MPQESGSTVCVLSKYKVWSQLTNSVVVSLSKLWEIVKDRESWRAAVHGVDKSWTRLTDKPPSLVV